MYRRLPAIMVVMVGFAFEGCSEPVPTVDMNAKAPGGPPPAAVPSVIAKKGARTKGASKPAAAPVAPTAN